MALRRALGWSEGDLMRSDCKPCTRLMRQTAGLFTVGGSLGFWVLCRLHYVKCSLIEKKHGIDEYLFGVLHKWRKKLTYHKVEIQDNCRKIVLFTHSHIPVALVIVPVVALCLAISPHWQSVSFYPFMLGFEGRSRITIPRSLRWAACGAVTVSSSTALLVRLLSPECEPQNIAAYDNIK